MAYVPGFKHDVFVSYAHDDDKLPPGEEKGWVTWLCEELTVRLGNRLGEQLNIWRDDRQRVSGTQEFDRVIEAAISSSAVFLVLLSPKYLGSDYCRKELRWFHEKASQDAIGLTTSAHHKRIVNVLLYNIPHPEWPEQLQRATGFDFFEARNETDTGEPFDTESEAYEDQRSDLIASLDALLKALKQASAPEPVAAETIPMAVFVADVPGALSEDKERMVQDIQGEGIDLILDTASLAEAAPGEGKAAEAPRRVDLSVHLLNDAPGWEKDGRRDRYPRLQFEWAQQHAGAQMLWVPEHLVIKDVWDGEHRAFLEKLAQRGYRESPYEIIRTDSRADFTQHVLEKIEQLRREKMTLTGSAASPKTCLLSTQDKDLGQAYQIAADLNNEGVRAYVEYGNNEDAFQTMLRKVKSLIVYYGTVSRGWVKARLDEALKLAVLEDWHDELKLGVYVESAKIGQEAPFKVMWYPIPMFESPNRISAFLANQR